MDLSGLHAKLADVVTDTRTRLGQVDANAFASALLVAVEEFLATPAPDAVPVSGLDMGPTELSGLPPKLVAAIRAIPPQVDYSAFALAFLAVVDQFRATEAPPAPSAQAAPVDGSTLPPITGTLDLTQGPQVSTPPAG